MYTAVYYTWLIVVCAQVEQLVKLMKNYVLRRMKEDVEKGVPPKQVQVEVVKLKLCALNLCVLAYSA
jgi:microcompartment protein CcmL/EutN